MLPIILDTASIALSSFTSAYVLTHWKERSQQKAKRLCRPLPQGPQSLFVCFEKMQYPEPPGGFAKKPTPCHGYGYCIGGQNSCSGIL